MNYSKRYYLNKQRMPFKFDLSGKYHTPAQLQVIPYPIDNYPRSYNTNTGYLESIKKSILILLTRFMVLKPT